MNKFIIAAVVLIVVAAVFYLFQGDEPYVVLVYPKNNAAPETLGVFNDLSNATFSAKQYVQSNPEADYVVKKNCREIPGEGEVCEEIFRRFEFSGEEGVSEEAIKEGSQ